MNMIDLEQMRREWVEVTRKNGFREGITDLLAHQYSTKTHFIYELLQNAEDALATEAEFRVENTRIIFSHNGKRMFSDENVESITSIGKSSKRTDYTQIGKHGIGFKAVFAYTHTPRIHSGDKHFEIQDVVVPFQLSNDKVPLDLKPAETRIILPFDSDELPEDRRFREFIPAEKAKADISDALTKLNIRTLLFLRHIEKIRWTLADGSEGVLSRGKSCVSESPRYVHLEEGDQKESWLVFEQKTNVNEDGKEHECIVEVAYLVENGKVIPTQNTELVVYFPTEKKTGLSFLIQGPFKTTKARDNIDKGSKANKDLLATAAILAANSLETLRDLGLLQIESYKALPLNPNLFQDDESKFFLPIYNAVRDALNNKNLLLADNGAFIPAKNAKLARVADLRKVINNDQLNLLYSAGHYKWLSGDITDRPATNSLWKYLTEQLNVEEIRPIKFAELLNDSFMEQQTDEWMIDFYSFIDNDRSELWKKPDAILKKKKILRLEDGSHVIPFKPDGTPNAYLPTSGITNFPTIKKNIFADKSAADFLRNLNIFEPDSFAEVIEFVLPKYVGEKISVATDENITDLNKIIRLIHEQHSTNLSTTISKLRILLTKLGWSQFEEMFTRNESKTVIPLLFKMVLPSIKFIQSTNGAINEYRSPSEVHLLSPEFENYYKGNSEIWLVCSDYPDELKASLKELGVNLQPKVSKKGKDSNGNVEIRSWHGSHKRGLDGFDPDWSIAGLQQSILSISLQKSCIIWNIIKQHSCCIRGIVESSSRQNFQDSKKKDEISSTGKLLIDHSWLPDKSGTFHNPSELQLTDLPDEFDKHSSQARELAEKLGMRKPEHQHALDTLSHGNQRLKRCLEALQNADDSLLDKIEKLIPSEKITSEFASFKEGVESLHRSQRRTPEQDGPPPASTVTNPIRYQENLDNEVIEAVEDAKKPNKVRFSIVRETTANKEARDFLYQEYAGKCQVTGDTFNKANGQNYFVAVCLVSRLEAEHLNHQGNMLCLSAETAAKFMYASFSWFDDLETKIQDFKTEIDAGNEQHRTLRINLAGQDTTITWSEKHFMRLKALWDNA